MAKREPLSKKTRFEIFKRDKFTCQYCGRTAPDVILEVDHIKPISDDGTNDILNLITSCRDFNRGKGKTPLIQNTVIKKQHDILADLEEKRQQLEMLIEWKKGLEEFEDYQVNQIEKLFIDGINGVFSEEGRKQCYTWLKKYGFDETYESAKISIAQYYSKDNDKEYVFDSVGRIAETRLRQKKDPRTYEINYLVKMSKDTICYIDPSKIKLILYKNYKTEDFSIIKEFIQMSNYGDQVIKYLKDYYDLEEELWH